MGILRGLSTLINSLAKTDHTLNIDLETATDNFLVARDGSLGIAFWIDGVFKMIGSSEFEEMVNDFSSGLRDILKNSGIKMDWAFHCDPTKANFMMTQRISDRNEQSSRLGLNWEDLHEGTGRAVQKFIREEGNMVVFWASPSSLSQHDRKSIQEQRLKEIRPYTGTPFQIQRLGGIMAPLIDRISTIGQSVEILFKKNNLNIERMSTEDALRKMRQWLIGDLCHPKWQPRLPGMKGSLNRVLAPWMATVTKNPKPQDLLWPSLAVQLLPLDLQEVTPDIIKVGDVYFAPISIMLLPLEFKGFQSLLDQVSQQNIPWRISFHLSGEGPLVAGFKIRLAQLLAIDKTSPQNQQLVQSSKVIYERTLQSVAQFQIQIDAITWANSLEKVKEQSNILFSLLQGWGNLDVEKRHGRGLNGFLASVPGVILSSTANRSCIRSDEASILLPITRPASLWPNGALWLRSADGKLTPYQIGSRRQGEPVILVSGPPGYGKSNLMMSLVKSILDTHGETSWPIIAYLDIGFSIQGFVNLLHDSLPPNMIHMASFFKMTKDPSHSINPFDTPLGCWQPFPAQESFLVNWLIQMADNMPGGSGFITKIVREAYKRYGPKEIGGRPRLYQEGICPSLDQLIQRWNLIEIIKQDDPNYPVSWWDLVDLFFERDDLVSAEHAQRYASPTLSDITGYAKDQNINAEYKLMVISTTQEPAPDYLARMLTEAVSLYPHMSSTTRFTIGSAKIVAMDLNEVCPKATNEAARKETALMYMVARQAVCGHFYAEPSDVELVRPGVLTSGAPMPMATAYRAFHAKRIESLYKSRKLMVCDEYHRAKDQPAFNAQIMNDIRTGRKYKVWIMLASQSTLDFPPDIIEEGFLTSLFIMGTGDENSIKRLATQLNLSPTASEYLRKYLMKPTIKGASMMAIHKTDMGLLVQYQLLSTGPMEMWATTTSSDDVSLRRLLERYLGSTEARRRLSQRFGSSAQTEIDRRRQNMMTKHGAVGDVQQNGDVIEELAKELLQSFSS